MPKYYSNIDLVGAQRVINAADPQAAQDLATKNYVDTQVQSQAFKNPARAATTAALPTNTLTSNVLTATANGTLPAQDGVTLAVGDSLLVKNEATAANNGIYTVTALGSVGAPWTLTRRNDANTSAKVVSGIGIDITEGTTYADKGFILATVNPITLNTTALTFNIGPSSSAYGSVSRVSGLIGDGSSTSIPYTHNLNNQFLASVVLSDATTNAQVQADVAFTSANVVTVSFASAPASNAYRIVCAG
jgi:hypothetical protein